jgi:26S proteasome regulatory subunit N11
MSGDSPSPDCAEKVHVSSWLLKMLNTVAPVSPWKSWVSCWASSWMTNYQLRGCLAMPQSGTSVVEAVDPVFQTKCAGHAQADGTTNGGGWYHSHPGFGCWLSSTDINTQSSFEALNSRAVVLVVDPIQSVREGGD